MALAPLTAATRGAILNHVTWVFDTYVEITCSDRALRRLLRVAGARRAWFRFGTWRWSYTDERELASIFGRLRDAGFAFAGAAGGWPPAAIFAHLRERGLIVGTCVELLWSGPGQPVVSEA